MSPRNDSSDLFSNLSQKRSAKENSDGKADSIDSKAKTRHRAIGKRSNTEYIQKGAYIKRTTDKSVKRLLIESDMDFSELVETLLNQWIEEQSG